MQLAVDGKYSKFTVQALQRFLDSNRVDGDHEAFNAPRSSGAFFAALERALIG